MNLIEPKELTLTTQAGVEKTFLLSKFPAIAGREIVAKYPVTNMPKVGEYQQSEEVMLKLMAHVAVVNSDGTPQRLTTRALVDNHVGDWETLAKIEWSQLEYNVSFFAKGRSSDFYEHLIAQAQPWITKILTALSGPSSQAGKPPSTS